VEVVEKVERVVKVTDSRANRLLSADMIGAASVEKTQILKMYKLPKQLQLFVVYYISCVQAKSIHCTGLVSCDK